MKLFRNALAAVLALACLTLVGPAPAANLVTRDAANVTHTLCAKTQSGIEYPCETIYGQKADGTLVALPIGADGNLLTSQTFVLTTPAKIDATTSSQRVQLPAGTNYVLTNRSSTVDLYYSLGTSSVTASTSSFVLQAGRSIVVAPGTNTYIAAVTGSSTATLDITGGYGTPIISGGGGGGGSGGDASAANQTAVQATAGSDASKAIAVQGVTGGKSIPVNDAGGSLTVDGSVSLTGTLPAFASTPAVTISGTPNVSAAQSGTWNVTNISGTVSLPTGAATAANQTATQGTKAAGTAATNSDLIGAVYNTSLPTLTNGQQAAAQADSSGRIYVNVGASALPTGAAADSSVTAVQAIIGAATAPTKMGAIGGVYVSSAPTLTTGQSFAARMDSHGSLVVTCANSDGTLCGDISTVKTDQTTHGTTDLVAADTTKIGGAAVATGAGNVSSGSQRVAVGFPGGTAYTLSMSTATTTEVVPLSGSTVTYVLFNKVRAEGATTLTWKYGTGTNCGTGTTTLDGPYVMATGNGWVEGNGMAPVWTVPAGKALCMTSSAAVVVNIRVMAVQF